MTSGAAVWYGVRQAAHRDLSPEAGIYTAASYAVRLTFKLATVRLTCSSYQPRPDGEGTPRLFNSAAFCRLFNPALESSASIGPTAAACRAALARRTAALARAAAVRPSRRAAAPWGLPSLTPRACSAALVRWLIISRSCSAMASAGASGASLTAEGKMASSGSPAGPGEEDTSDAFRVSSLRLIPDRVPRASGAVAFSFALSIASSRLHVHRSLSMPRV
jgi:hypothetical protein